MWGMCKIFIWMLICLFLSKDMHLFGIMLVFMNILNMIEIQVEHI